MIIGITGKAGVGKDTVADHLISQYGFVKYSMAQPIKDLLNARHGWSNADWQDREWKERPNVWAGIGADGYYMSPRQCAQWLGTEAGRMVHGEDCWIKIARRKIEDMLPASVVISDIRFRNEAQFVRDMGGVIVRIDRDVAPVADHESETMWFEPDVTIVNNGTMGELFASAAMLAGWKKIWPT